MQKAHDASKNNWWRNKPNIDTPITQNELNRVETTIDVIDDRVVGFDLSKANQSDLLQSIKGITYNTETGVWVFTWWNGNTLTVDQNIEKIPVSFSMSPQGIITMTTSDGTQFTCDIAALIKTYSFLDSDTIDFTDTVDSDGNHTITADIKNGSVTGEKLQPNYLADCVLAKQGAESAEANAQTSEETALTHQYNAEAWAKGTKNNVPVTPADAQYHDNAYYWAQQARAIVGDKVDSFNGRTGTVVAEDGDYPSDYIVPETGAIPGQVPVVRNVGTGQDVKLRYINEDLDIGLKPHIIVISETGSTVRLVKGGTTIYATETSTEHFECDVTEFGTWTVHSVLNEDDSTVSLVVDTVKIYTVDDSHWHADITVTYPTGGTCSCSKSGTTTLYATGSPYTFTVHESGTYTITATANGETYTQTVEVTTSGQTESLTIPEGSTVTPTDSVATLLSCAGIHDTSIMSVSDLLADTTTLLAVINSTNAVDYLVRSTTFATDVCADSTAMSYIGLNNYAANTLLGEYNPNLVPIMTSNTTPSGVCSGTNKSSDTDYYYAFNGDATSSTKVKPAVSATSMTVGYEFTEAVEVGWTHIVWDIYRHNTTITVKLQQYYNNEWVDISSDITVAGSSGDHYMLETDIPCVSTHPSTQYRAYVSGDLSPSSTSFHGISQLQFYKKDYSPEVWLNAICNSTYFESVLNVKVPTMTSYTAPSGEAFATTESTSNFPAWKAFDNSDTTAWCPGTNDSNNAVGYDFGDTVAIHKTVITAILNVGGSSPASATFDFHIQGSNTSKSSGFEDITTKSIYYAKNSKKTETFSFANSGNYRYNRLMCPTAMTTSTYSTNVNTVQFYGREDV